jgi:hypothetical protein
MRVRELLLEMSTVYRGQGIKMMIYFKDTHPYHVPHIHISQQNNEIVVSLLDSSIIVDNPKFHKRLKKISIANSKQQYTEI